MEDIVVTSAQVLFPDRMTLDEKVAAILKENASLKTRIATLEAAATTTTET